MNSKLILSIYILTYNRAESVKAQVEFFLKEIEQLSTKVELIVSDNASTDKTEEYILQYNCKKNFRYIKNDKNYGLNGNAYLSVDRARGEFLWIIGDDSFKPGVVKHVLNIIENHKDINFVYLNTRPCYGKNPYGNMEYQLEKYGFFNYTWGFVEENKYTFSRLMTFTSCIIHKRETMQQTVELIPLDGDYEYSWSYFEGLISLLKGNGYIEKEVWVFDQAMGITWSDYAIIAYSSMVRSHKLLKNLKVNKKLIRQMKKNCLHISPALKLAFLEISKCGKYRKDAFHMVLYSLLLDPIYTVKTFLFN